ncbi:MAG: glycosyl transferase [Pseudomonadota bacterium]
MNDYHQSGLVATLHNLTNPSLDILEQQLVQFSKKRPITLILPCLFSELEGPALHNIIEQLSHVPYLNHIVIGLDRADETQYKYAKDYFSKLPQEHKVLWNDGAKLQEIDQKLKSGNLAPLELGKGRNVWYCIGYVLASAKTEVIALHDCDITTYSRDLLAKLVYPVANPSFNYLFSKGYYPRIGDGRINGRVTRLLVTPLLIGLKKIIGNNAYIDYLASFRYPLAGEFAMRTSILPDIRIPSDWGLEIGILSEVWRNLNERTICQVDIADKYDHKHQSLSKDNPKQGLSRMSMDIAKVIFRKLALDGIVFHQETFRTLKAIYLRTALDIIEAYYNDAVMNGLIVDRHKDEEAVELFAANIVEAGQVFLDNPMEAPFIPNWRRIQSAIPDLLQELNEAVEADNASL